MGTPSLLKIKKIVAKQEMRENELLKASLVGK